MSHSPETSSAADDAALIAALKNGDYAAFESVYLAEFRGLHRYAASLVLNDDAIDAVQDVFFAIWNNRTELPVNSLQELRYYLFRAVRNRAYKINRHDSVRNRHSNEIANSADVAGIPGSGSHYEEDESGRLRDSLGERVEQVISELPSRSREILTLRWYHNMSFDKIADIMGVSYTYTHVLHSRALGMIRKRLGLK